MADTVVRFHRIGRTHDIADLLLPTALDADEIAARASSSAASNNGGTFTVSRPHVYSHDCWCDPQLTRPANPAAGDPGRVVHIGITPDTVWLREGDAIGLGLLTGSVRRG